MKGAHSPWTTCSDGCSLMRGIFFDPVCLLTEPSGSGCALSSGQRAHNSPPLSGCRATRRKLKWFCNEAIWRDVLAQVTLDLFLGASATGNLCTIIETAVLSNCISIFITDAVCLFVCSWAYWRVERYSALCCTENGGWESKMKQALT